MSCSGLYFLVTVRSEEKLQEIAIFLNLIPQAQRRDIESWFRLDYPFLLELLVRQSVFFVDSLIETRTYIQRF